MTKNVREGNSARAEQKRGRDHDKAHGLIEDNGLESMESKQRDQYR